MKFTKILSSVLFLLLISITVQGETFSGKVVGVKDGDTIVVMKDGAPVIIRLNGIDCPENGQDFGTKAKQATSELCFNKFVKVEVKELDRYGRTVATIILPDGKNLNEELVKSGLARLRAFCD